MGLYAKWTDSVSGGYVLGICLYSVKHLHITHTASILPRVPTSSLPVRSRQAVLRLSLSLPWSVCWKFIAEICRQCNWATSSNRQWILSFFKHLFWGRKVLAGVKIQVQLIVLHHLGKYNGNPQLQLSYLTDPLTGKHSLCFLTERQQTCIMSQKALNRRFCRSPVYMD